MTSNKAKITDVAARAGVSIKTVSRVMNHEANVRPATRERVRQAAATLDYKPNPAARGLAGRRTFAIGLLYENPHEYSYTQRTLEGVFASCEQAGYTLLLRPCKDDSGERSRAQAARDFVDQTRVDGVILPAPLSDDDGVLAALRASDTPTARIAPGAPDDSCCSVRANDRDGARALTAHLLALGHRRIAFVAGDPRHDASAQRLAGYRLGLQEHGVAPDDALVAQGMFDYESGQRAGRALLTLPRRPTAIFAGNDEMAAGVVAAAHELALAVPAAVSVAGFDDSPIASRTWPALSTARQPVFAMAAALTRDLIAQLRGEVEAVRHRVFDCPLVLRASSAPPAPTNAERE